MVERPGRETSKHQPAWTVEDFPCIRGAAGRGILYPSSWPEGHYLLCDNQGYGLEPTEEGMAIVADGETHTLAQLLGQENFTPLSERTALIAIGSNRSPLQIRKRVGKMADPTPDDLVVPVCSVDITGMDTIYAARPSAAGGFPVMAYAAQETRDTVLNAAVLFLNERQLACFDSSEAGSYERTELPGCEIEVDGMKMRAQFYKSTALAFWDEHGPRAARAIKAQHRHLPEQTQLEFLETVLGHLKRHGGMRVFEGIYFDDSREAQQILASYDQHPPYPHELSGVFYAGHVGVEATPKMAGTLAVQRKMGELGLTRAVGVPDDFVCGATQLVI